jgi:hypothetical protein
MPNGTPGGQNPGAQPAAESLGRRCETFKMYVYRSAPGGPRKRADVVSANFVKMKKPYAALMRPAASCGSVGTIVPVPDYRLLTREAASCPIEDSTYSLLGFGLAAA